MTRSRRDQAKAIKRLRDEGRTWAEVTAQVGVSQTTGRKLLREFETELTSGKAARVEPPPAPEPEPTTAPQHAPAAGAARVDEPAEPGPEPRRSGRYLKLTCGCEEPTVIRASKTVAAKGTVHCNTCRRPFTEEAAA